jgi:hypothetical protein
LNKKHQIYLTNEELQTLKNAEKNYFKYNTLFWANSLLFLCFRPIRRFKIINFYIGIVSLISGKSNSIYLIKDDIIRLRKKISLSKEMRIRHFDLFDETNITDWRCYLYYYKIL